VLGNKKLFLSAVSGEFLAYRNLLTGDLKRPALDVAVQEDFIGTDGSTLAKLDDYIRACDGIIHLIGKSTGDAPEEFAVAALLQKYPVNAAMRCCRPENDGDQSPYPPSRMTVGEPFPMQ
jgi:hypothetical protein